ncbi:hypothetical protein OUZ56_008626 [Daphnia magna]|uniref:Uncharacterized protein n=1 Tax=Daphnia magna TaxID=35525 RepID=A0ABR0ADY1_9CRUS|nr:hypothetical protein OUZ56_008626 [Daphnia magna]
MSGAPVRRTSDYTCFCSLRFIRFPFKYCTECRNSHGLVLQFLSTFLLCFVRHLALRTVHRPQQRPTPPYLLPLLIYSNSRHPFFFQLQEPSEADIITFPPLAFGRREPLCEAVPLSAVYYS